MQGEGSLGEGLPAQGRHVHSVRGAGTLRGGMLETVRGGEDDEGEDGGETTVGGG